ncbi:hypothetical protein [Reyranella soli]|uniref:hypothetical protein n=1 Tax=Reyranella soli TaxID=1230389 RepID=UPI00147806AD|nr:hypothetical protein [Reyranella soli]
MAWTTPLAPAAMTVRLAWATSIRTMSPGRILATRRPAVNSVSPSRNIETW